MWTAGPTIAGVKHEQTAMAPARAGQPGSAYEALLLPSRCCVARDKRHNRGRSLEGGRPAARSAAGASHCLRAAGGRGCAEHVRAVGQVAAVSAHVERLEAGLQTAAGEVEPSVVAHEVAECIPRRRWSCRRAVPSPASRLGVPTADPLLRPAGTAVSRAQQRHILVGGRGGAGRRSGSRSVERRPSRRPPPRTVGVKAWLTPPTCCICCVADEAASAVDGLEKPICSWPVSDRRCRTT